MKWRSMVLILWLSFLIAGFASAFVFALIDPLDVAIFGYFRPKRDVLYAGGFFFFWLITASTGVLTWYMLPKEQNGHNEIGF